MLKHKMIPLLLIGSLGVSACSQTTGDFCDIAEPIRFERDVAVAVVTGDRGAAEKIDAHNRFGEEFCGWSG